MVMWHRMVKMIRGECYPKIDLLALSVFQAAKNTRGGIWLIVDLDFNANTTIIINFVL